MNWLFDSSEFLTRDHCGKWTPVLKSAYIAANVAIAASYFAIPIALAVMHRRRRGDIIARWVLAMFAAFILSCGLTHVADAMAFHWAAYRLYTLLVVVTAATSLPTAIALPVAILRAWNSPTPEQYLSAIEKVRAESESRLRLIDSQKALIRELRHQIRNLEQIRELGVWTDGQQKILEKLYGIVNKGENGIVNAANSPGS